MTSSTASLTASYGNHYRRPISRKLATLASGAFLCTSLFAFGSSLWINSKAVLSQNLIKDAWEETLKTPKDSPVKPWPWADTWPIARLKVPDYNIDFYVLAGSQGSSLAFGPGHVDGTAMPTANGTIVFSGHRDTHFSFLQNLKQGHTLQVQNKLGYWRDYQVIYHEVKNSTKEQWFINKKSDELKLITCYPFDSINPSGPLRYIVTAVPL